MVRAHILKHVGVPVSIGVAGSKTLAKAANHWAKKHPETGGSMAALEPPATATVLAGTPVADIWGVGWKLAPRLKAEGIHTALDLKAMNPHHAQQLMGIRGRQMVEELNGTACFPLQKEHKPQQMIMRGRQFGEDTREFYVIESAIASLAARAAAALRREHQLARQAAVVLRTNRHRPGYQQVSESVQFYTPTADTGIITSQLTRMLASSWRGGLDYHRADVLLHDFVPETGLQTDLLGTVDLAADTKSSRKMRAVDQLNLRHGKGTVKFAAEHLSHSWQPRKRLMSPRYTSTWDELPEARVH